MPSANKVAINNASATTLQLDREDQLFVYGDFDPSELAERRRRVGAELNGARALVASLPAPNGMWGVRQTNEFYYLTGLDCAGAYILLEADGSATLYLKPRDAKREDIDGPELSDEDGEFIQRVAGINRVKPIAELVIDLTDTPKLFLLREPAEGYRQTHDSLRAYARSLAADPFHAGYASLEEHLLLRLAQRFPAMSFGNLTPILRRLRLVKSPAELRLMREAGRLSGMGVAEAMRCTQSGVNEYELAAVCDYVFRAGGAFGGAHQAIAASGDRNIYAMHYWRANSTLRDGDLMLLDYAPDYRYYTSDIGRMWPVNGTYSADQRSLYGLCIEYHKLLLTLIRPGRTRDDIFAEAAGTFRPVLEKWSFPNESSRSAGLDMLESKRPLSHAVGMAIHDPGDWTTRPLQVGDVFAVDPELFIRDLRQYIRCEDTVAVTEDGCEILTKCPLEMDDVEQLMANAQRDGGGLLQRYPVSRTDL